MFTQETNKKLVTKNTTSMDIIKFFTVLFVCAPALIFSQTTIKGKVTDIHGNLHLQILAYKVEIKSMQVQLRMMRGNFHSRQIKVVMFLL